MEYGKRYILLMFVVLMCCQMRAQQTFTIMSYNIENAFDTIHDEGKNDYEYCDGGERKWSQYRLFQKLKSVGKVIAAADEKRPVDLIGLCEVENDTVMQCLTQRTSLSSLGYRYIMTNSLDERGIDVALLYSPFTFHPIETESIRPKTKKDKTRDILHVAGTIAGGRKTRHVIFCTSQALLQEATPSMSMWFICPPNEVAAKVRN